MKFPNTFCSHQRNSPTFEEFLISNYETIENNSQNINNESNRTTASVKQTSNRVRPEPKHISRRYHYVNHFEDKDSAQHRSILEAPFVRMKEIHINPPRHPIKEDSKKFRYLLILL